MHSELTVLESFDMLVVCRRFERTVLKSPLLWLEDPLRNSVRVDDEETKIQIGRVAVLLGVFYYTNLDTFQNDQLARRYFELGMKIGISDGYIMAGIMASRGHGQPENRPNIALAQFYLEKARVQNPEADQQIATFQARAPDERLPALAHPYGLRIDKHELMRSSRTDFSRFLTTLLADGQLQRFQKMQRLMILAREETQEGLIKRIIKGFESGCRSIAEMAYQAACERLLRVEDTAPDHRAALLDEVKSYIAFGHGLLATLQEKQTETLLALNKQGERYLAELQKINTPAATYLKQKWPLFNNIAPIDWQSTRSTLDRNWAILQSEFKKKDTIFTLVGEPMLQNFAPLVAAFNQLFPMAQDTLRSCRDLIDDHYITSSDSTPRQLGEAIRYYLGSLSDSKSLALPQDGAVALKLVEVLERDTVSDRKGIIERGNVNRWRRRPKRLLMVFDDPTVLYLTLLEAVPREGRFKVIKDFNNKLSSLTDIVEDSSVGDFDAERLKAQVTSLKAQKEALLKLIDFSDFLLLYEEAYAPPHPEHKDNLAQCYEWYSESSPFLKALRTAMEHYQTAQSGTGSSRLGASRHFFAALVPWKSNEDDAQMVEAKNLLLFAEKWILNSDFIKGKLESFFESFGTPPVPGTFAWCLMEQLAPALKIDIAVARAENLSDAAIFNHFTREFTETYFGMVSQILK